MSTFNKLYNLILQSIITEDIESKIKKAIDTLIKSGQLTGQDDPKAQQVKAIIKRNNSIDINGKTKLDQLLKANQQYINRAEVAKDNYLDNIPEFYNKQEYPNNVVIYRVRDSKDGMMAVRKVVDAQWGKEANPWCLISRNKYGFLEGAWNYWTHYNRFPKQIAFQNGKLVAFRASRASIDYWWNRQDKKSTKLKPLEGKSINVPPAQWTEEERKQKEKDIIATFKQQFVYNEKTGRWDTKNKNIFIHIDNQLIVNGDLPFAMGTIDGSIEFKNCNNLTSLDNGPTKITGNIYYDNKIAKIVLNSKMYKLYESQSTQRYIERFELIYNPETKRYDANKNIWVDPDYIIDHQLPVPFGVIKGNFDIRYCNNLKYTDYLPTKVTGIFEHPENTRIGKMIQKSDFYAQYINQTPERFIKKHALVYNPETKMYDSEYAVQIDPWDLIGWDHIPVKLGKIKGFFRIERNRDIETLQNAPEEVGGYVMLMYNGQLKSLQGFPKYVGKQVQLDDIAATSLDGMQNTTIEGSFDIRGLAYLQSLDNFPKLKGNLIVTMLQYRKFKDFIIKHNIKCGDD